MLEPVNLTVLAYLTAADLGPRRTQSQVAAGLGISQSNVHRALAQLDRSGLLGEGGPHRAALHEPIVHAVRYVFPGELGAPSRGIATAHAGPTLASQARSDTPYVWPFDAGAAFGPSIEPLHPCVPAAAARCAPFYELMALIDVLRVSRARERDLGEHPVPPSRARPAPPGGRDRDAQEARVLALLRRLAGNPR